MRRNETRPDGHLTEAETAELVGVTAGRLCKLRRGHRYRGRTRKGTAYYSTVPPVLSEGVHFVWSGGRVWYTPRGVEFLTEHAATEESRTGKETGALRTA